MNKKDCNEYDSCMEAMKVCKANGTVCWLIRDPDNEELVIDLHCEACSHYRTTGDH